MDTIRKQLTDDKRAEDIFARVRSRLSGKRIKTNEVYIELLIDEINKYFADMSTCTIDSNDLPTVNSGPVSNKHNKLISNIASDIDKVHKKRVEVQDLITKTANYLSTERVSINNAVSKMQARVVNQKLRNSMNDRHLTVFTEYFTDDNYVDKKLSSNVEVDPSLSALTLLPIVKKEDNSALIDPTSIFLQVQINADSHSADSLYPISEAMVDQNYIAGFGKTLSNDPIQTDTVNSNSAGYKDPATYLPIQQQCLQVGVNGGEDLFTHGEFELVFNDLNEANGGLVLPTIRDVIKKVSLTENHTDIDDNHIVFDISEGNSFGGAKLNQTTPTDERTIFDKIKGIGLSFSLKEGSFPGYVSYVLLRFVPTSNTVNVPEIDYMKSYIKDNNGKQYTFREMSLNNKTNVITETKYLVPDSVISNPVSVYVAFKLDSLTPSVVNAYTGTYWKVRMTGNEVNGSVVLPGDTTATDVSISSNRYLYVYHDPQRVAAASQVNTLNERILNSIISVYKTSLTTAQAAASANP